MSYIYNMNRKSGASNSLASIIANNKTVIISLQGCPYCIAAKKILQKYTRDYVEVIYEPVAHRDWIFRQTGRTSLPAVFINKCYIGGCNDGGFGGVSTLDKDGRLKAVFS
jgi:glutaredoxin